MSASRSLRDIRKALPPLPAGPSDAPYPYNAEFLAGYTHCCEVVASICEQLEGVVYQALVIAKDAAGQGDELMAIKAWQLHDQLEALVGAVGEKKP
jgi:hypothetical protein